MVLKRSFCNIYENFMREGKTLPFFVPQGKAPEEILQNVAGSLGHVTALLGTLCVWDSYVGNGKFKLINEK